MGEPTEKPPKEIESEDEEDQTFETLGLDGRLIRALNKKKIHKPTPIQQVAISLILQGKDVVVRAKDWFWQDIFLSPSVASESVRFGIKEETCSECNRSRELSQQVYSEVSSLTEFCRVPLKVVQLTSSMPALDWRTALAALPEILVTAPVCIKKCLSDGVLQPASIDDSLEILVLDEADLLLSYGYEADIKAFTPHIPKRCQCLRMSATASDDVEKLKKLILHNSYILTLPEVGDIKDDVIPKNVQQFWVGLVMPLTDIMQFS